MDTTLKDALDAAGVDTSTLATFWEGPTGPIYTLTVPGAEAVARWRTLRALVPQTGHWPVLLGGQQDLEAYRNRLVRHNTPSSAGIIRQALEMSPQGWIAEQAMEWNSEDEELSLDGYHGDWPEGDEASHGFYTPTNCCDEGALSLYIGLVPTIHSWEIPALLRWGGWNACPPPEVHVSLIRDWHDRYGAEIVAATRDIIEMQIARPPKTREAAVQLAREQFLYCEDIVTQGTGTFEGLAATLLHGTVWFFWWD